MMSTTKTPLKSPVTTTLPESPTVVAPELPAQKIITPLTPKLRAPSIAADRTFKIDDSERLARIASNPEPLSAKPLLDPPGSSTISPRKAVPRKAPVRTSVTQQTPPFLETSALTPLVHAMSDEFIDRQVVEQSILAKFLQEPNANVAVAFPIESTNNSKLKKIEGPATRSASMTLAQRLEMARLARESAPPPIIQTNPIVDDDANEFLITKHQPVNASVLAKPTPMSVRKVPASALIEKAMATSMSIDLPTHASQHSISTEQPAAAMPLDVPKNTTRRVVASKTRPHTSTKSKTSPVLAARNVMLGFALAYVEQFERHIGGPLMTLWTHKGSFISGFFHVMMPLLLAYLCSHWTPETQAFFLEGGYMSNLGKLSWLYVVSGFLWTLLFMLASRLFISFKHDSARFERIGRGFLSPHNDN